MVQQKIQLRKVRDFGENLNDTFQFIRQEFKPLVGSFLLIAGVFIIAQAIVMGLYEGKMFAFFDNITKGLYSQPSQSLADIFTPQYFLAIFCSLLSLVAMRVIIACYMRLYDEKNESPTVREVFAMFTRYFLKNVIFSAVVFVLIIIGVVLCIVPGIYLAVVLTPFQFILVTEDLSFGDAFSRCFTLIRENFWITLGLYLVVYLISAFGSGIISFFVGLIVGLASYFTTREVGSTVGIVTSVISAISHVFYIIFLVSIAMHYYNLVERIDGTGMARRLESLGDNTNPNENIEEQY